MSGALALAAFIGGLFCRRLKIALIAGGVPALVYAALVVVGLWHLLADANLFYLLGALTAFCLAILAAAVLGFGLRRALIRLFDTRLSETGLG